MDKYTVSSIGQACQAYLYTSKRDSNITFTREDILGYIERHHNLFRANRDRNHRLVSIGRAMKFMRCVTDTGENSGQLNIYRWTPPPPITQEAYNNVQAGLSGKETLGVCGGCPNLHAAWGNNSTGWPCVAVRPEMFLNRK